MFSFQFKKRKALPSWLFEWLDGICVAAKRTNTVGVVVMKTPGMEDGDALVVLRWRDWVDLHGPEKFGQMPHRRRPT